MMTELVGRERKMKVMTWWSRNRFGVGEEKNEFQFQHAEFRYLGDSKSLISNRHSLICKQIYAASSLTYNPGSYNQNGKSKTIRV